MNINENNLSNSEKIHLMDVNARKHTNDLMIEQIKSDRKLKIWVSFSTILASLIGSSVLIFNNHKSKTDFFDFKNNVNSMSEHIIDMDADLKIMHKKIDNNSAYCTQTSVYAQKLYDLYAVQYVKPNPQ